MKVKYMFSKPIGDLNTTYKVYDGFSAFARIDEPYQILNAVFNWRVEDAQSWSDIIEDIQLILSTPDNENVYNTNGTLYQGKYNIEQSSNPTAYCLRVSYSTENAISPLTIYSYRTDTLLYSSERGLSLYVPTKQMLNLVIRWRDFLLSDNNEEERNLDIDMQEVVSS